jgi:hypothetical protein
MTEPRPRRRKRAPSKRRLTELFVKKLKPKPDAYLVWDTLQRGLAIRVQPSGGKAWKWWARASACSSAATGEEP